MENNDLQQYWVFCFHVTFLQYSLHSSLFVDAEKGRLLSFRLRQSRSRLSPLFPHCRHSSISSDPVHFIQDVVDISLFDNENSHYGLWSEKDAARSALPSFSSRALTWILFGSLTRTWPGNQVLCISTTKSDWELKSKHQKFGLADASSNLQLRATPWLEEKHTLNKTHLLCGCGKAQISSHVCVAY